MKPAQKAPSDLETAIEAVREADTPAFAIDDSQRIVAWNEQAERLTGRGADEVLGRLCYDVLGALDAQGNALCRNECNVVWACLRGRPVFAFPVSIPTRGGPARAVVSLIVLPTREGPVLLHLLRPEGSSARTADGPDLTAREKEILRMLAGGRVVKEVAVALCVSVATVRAHVRSSLRKLGAHTQREAIVRAFRSGRL